MKTLEIELTDEVYQTLVQLAQENETEPTALLRAQIERLTAAYKSSGLTPGLHKQLETSMQEHRSLLQRLAQ